MKMYLSDFFSFDTWVTVSIGELKEKKIVNSKGHQMKTTYAPLELRLQGVLWRFCQDNKILFGKFDYSKDETCQKVGEILDNIFFQECKLTAIDISLLGDCVFYFSNLLKIEFFSVTNQSNKIFIERNGEGTFKYLPIKNTTIYIQDILDLYKRKQ